MKHSKLCILIALLLIVGSLSSQSIFMRSTIVRDTDTIRPNMSLRMVTGDPVVTQAENETYGGSGQSNWQGRALVDSIPAEYSYIPVEPDSLFNVRITDLRSELVGLMPGRPRAFQFDDSFGPEMTLMDTVGKNTFSLGHIAKLMTHGRGGRAMAYFLELQGSEDLPSYINWHLNKLIENGITNPYYSAFFWMQGESDGFDPNNVLYQGRLERFIDTVRIWTNQPDLPFVLVELKKGVYTPEIIEGQNNVAQWKLLQDGTLVYNPSATRKNTFIIDSQNYGRLPDGAHYDAAGLIEMGYDMYYVLQHIRKFGLEQAVP